jgi:cysteine desulfurase/selenocysteine lyase
MTFNPETLRAEFPILDQMVNGKPLVYLDNAATSQKPRAVLNASRDYYEHLNSNIHRGTHALARAATAAFEAAREVVARHLNAPDSASVIFTSGCTDGINLVANILALSGRIAQGDSIVVSGLEHHSNIVPWQMLCERTGARLEVIPVLDDGTLDLDAFHRLLSERTRLVAVTQISNAFGTPNPVREIIAAAHAAGALVLVDGAQSVPHLAVDVAALDVDFFCFSGHKAYAPTGIGALYGRRELLEVLPPWRGGGEMIKEVTFARTTYNDLPFKYEAGTPNIEGAIALGAALEFLGTLGLDAIHAHEQALIETAAAALADIPGIRLFGPANRIGALSFMVEGVHHYDLGTLMDQMGVAVRTGHHCCQPLMARFGITGTTRASFAVYNTHADVAALADSVAKAVRLLT